MLLYRSYNRSQLPSTTEILEFNGQGQEVLKTTSLLIVGFRAMWDLEGNQTCFFPVCHPSKISQAFGQPKNRASISSQHDTILIHRNWKSPDENEIVINERCQNKANVSPQQIYYKKEEL